MKNCFIIIFSIITISTFAQKYHFDIISTYTTTENKKKRANVVLANLNDQGYFLELQNGKAYLFDLRNKFRHDFKLKNNKMGKRELHYKNSIKLDQINPASDYSFKFETIKEDSVQKIIKMIRLKNNQIVDSDYTELTAKKISNNLFPLFRFSVMHLYEGRTEIDLNENLVILNSKYIGDTNREWQLTSFEETTLDVVVK